MHKHGCIARCGRGTKRRELSELEQAACCQSSLKDALFLVNIDAWIKSDSGKWGSCPWLRDDNDIKCAFSGRADCALEISNLSPQRWIFIARGAIFIKCQSASSLCLFRKRAHTRCLCTHRESFELTADNSVITQLTRFIESRCSSKVSRLACMHARCRHAPNLNAKDCQTSEMRRVSRMK